MTRHLDVDRTLESWLAEGPSHLPNHVIDGIVRQLDENDQRRSIWLPRRQQMNRMILAIGGVATAVVLAFVVVGLYLNGPEVAAPPQPTEPPRATSQPTGAPTASPAPSAVALPFGDDAIEPGRYFTEFKGYRYTFTVPDRDFPAEFIGWTSAADFDRWVVLWDGSGEVPNAAGMVIYSNVSTLYTEACQWLGSAITPGPTVDDFATALAALDGFESTEPTDVTVAGYQGKRVRITAPADVDIASCYLSQYQSFEGVSSAFGSPGQTNDVRILDLDGTRYLVVTHYQTGTPAEARAELDRMVDTLEIEPVGD